MFLKAGGCEKGNSSTLRGSDALLLGERRKMWLYPMNHFFIVKLTSFKALGHQGKAHPSRETLFLQRLDVCCLEVVCVVVTVEFSPLCLHVAVFDTICLN